MLLENRKSETKESNLWLWPLLFSLSVCIFFVVESPRFYGTGRWYVLLHRLWISLSTVQMLWMLICFAFFVVRSVPFYEAMYYIPFYLYVLFGAVTAFIIAFNVCSAVNGSVNTVKLSMSKEEEDAMDLSEFADPMTTFLALGVGHRSLCLGRRHLIDCHIRKSSGSEIRCHRHRCLPLLVCLRILRCFDGHSLEAVQAKESEDGAEHIHHDRCSTKTSKTAVH